VGLNPTPSANNIRSISKKAQISFGFPLTLLERLKHNSVMNKLSIEEKTQIISALVEGNSVRSTCRMTGHSKGAVLKLLVEVVQHA
jgi:hypothetical protein